jgi:predicted O-methyltransferase YrrM
MSKPVPNFEGVYGSSINALRLVYMIGAVWLLARQYSGRKLAILEIGSWCGASALTWGEALELFNDSRGKITCVDFWEPHHDIDINQDAIYKEMNDAAESGDAYTVFLQNIQSLPEGVEIEIIRGDSKEVLPSLEGQMYDLVYIDGDHTYESVKADINFCLELVNEGGILAGDDLEIQAHAVNNPISINEPVLDRVINAEYGSNYHPGVTLAVSEIFGPVSSWYGLWGMQKFGDEWKQFSLDGFPMHIPKFLPVKHLIKLKSLLHHPDLD